MQQLVRSALLQSGLIGRQSPDAFQKTGQLRIIDRAKDVGRLKDGTLFAPKYLENKLKFFSYVKEAVLFGNGRDFSTAFIKRGRPFLLRDPTPPSRPLPQSSAFLHWAASRNSTGSNSESKRPKR